MGPRLLSAALFVGSALLYAGHSRSERSRRGPSWEPAGGHAGEARAEGPPGPGEGKAGCRGQCPWPAPLAFSPLRQALAVGPFPSVVPAGLKIYRPKRSSYEETVAGEVVVTVKMPIHLCGASVYTPDCGKAPLADMLKGSRVVGGAVAQTGAWPWIVSLQIQSGKISTHVCGGSLVKNKRILTAAHCTKDSRDPLMWRAVIGTNNIHEKHSNTKKIKVKTIIIHPDFEIESYVNDIALFHLQRAVRYNDYIQPICLPFGVFQNLDQNTKCFVSGWGRTKEEGNVTNMLQEAEVHYISRNICNSEKSYGNIISSTSFCAGDEDGMFDTCRGDSGGPLMCYLPDHKQFFVMGISSYGYGCGRKNFPGVYCGPSFYQKWLTDHLYQASNKGIFNINILLGQILVALGSIVLLAMKNVYFVLHPFPCCT